MNSPFKTASPRISEDKFVQVLESVGSFNADALWGTGPQEARRDSARRIYEQIVEQGHDPGVWLALVGKESSFGTNQNSVLWRNNTRSWTNARSVRHPEVKKRATIITDSQRRSQYVRYQSVYDSVLDGLYRVDEPGYAYRQAGAVSIVDHIRIWAPGSDDNQPDGYARTMVMWIAEWMAADPSPPKEEPVSDIPGVRFVAADNRHYTRGRSVDWPDLLIQHHTDGWDSLAWLTTAPASNVSATYLLNHNGTIRAQLVRHADTPHTTGKMNPRSISIEWERKWPEQRNISDSQYRNIGESWAKVVLAERKRGNPHFQSTPKREQLQPHNAYYSTTCPGNLDMDRVYAEMVAALGGDKPAPPPDDGRRLFPETGKHILGGFRAHWERLERDGLAYTALGYPVTDEFRTLVDGVERTVQIFERGALGFYPESDPPWDIRHLTRGELWTAVTDAREQGVLA